MNHEIPDSASRDPRPVVVVGAGLAGLACAVALHRAGRPVMVLEGSDAAGGRVRTDEVDGFLLDRGFQVLLTAYPEAQRLLDYEALGLRAFYPGALVRYGGRFHKLADPWRRPRDAAAALAAQTGSLADKLRVAALRRRVARGSIESLFTRPERTTLEALRAEGFSDTVIQRFFRPFLGGVLLDPDLRASSRMFEFVFRMFAQGDAALPVGGMGAIARQIVAMLPGGTVRTGVRVAAVDESGVRLTTGERVEGSCVVVATDGPEAARLTGAVSDPGSRSVVCVYFAAPEPPLREPILVLNGEGGGIVNNMCVPSIVQPSYAPAGQALVSVSVLGMPAQSDADLENLIRGELAAWFGAGVYKWRHLHTYRIAHAQPDQTPPALEPPQRPVRLRRGLYVCGDHRDNASIQGALVSGRRAAEAVIADMPDGADRPL
jgi:phytoene dehydrogenase-like protein